MKINRTSTLILAALGILSGGANAALSAWNTTFPAAAAGTDATTGTGNFDWATTSAWADNTPANAASTIANLEPRLGVGATATVNADYTVGEVYARISGAGVSGTPIITGTGKLIFDNGASASNLYLTRSGVRASLLDPSINIDLQLNSTLNIYSGQARGSKLASEISGVGGLNLHLTGNDVTNTRFYNLGIDGANTYSGGTFVQHIGQATYGAGHATSNSVQIAAFADAFGTGDVTFNATGSNFNSAIGIARGMWIQLRGNDAIDDAAMVNLTSAANFAFDLNGKSQTVAAFVVDGVALAAGTYTAGSGPTWLFNSGAGGTLTIIPEPSAAAMLGLLGCTLLVRRRR